MKGNRAPRFVSTEMALSLNDAGGLRLAVIADTHSHPHPNAARWIRRMCPDGILHGGDIGDLAVLAQFGEIAPVIAVRGNIDERATDLPDAITIDIRASGASALKLLLTHIALYGPKLRADAARLAASSGAKIVVCGHSHVPFLGRDRGFTVFNPGSIGPRRFALPIMLGLLEIAGGKLSLRHVDCETGEDWCP